MISKHFITRKKVLSLASIGAGLVLLGVLAWVLLPRLGAAFSISKAGEQAWAVPVGVNFQAPELSLTDLQGNAVSLAAFRSYSLPNSYVIDQDGQVRLAWLGSISRKMLEEYVTPLLKE